MYNNNLKNIRINKGMKMSKMATLLDIKYTTYVSYEKGERVLNSETLIDIAKKLNVSVDYILCNDDESIKNDTTNNVQLTKHQQRVIEAYIAHPEMQQAINRLLGIDDEKILNNTDCEIAEDMAVFTKAVQSANLHTKQK